MIAQAARKRAVRAVGSGHSRRLLSPRARTGSRRHDRPAAGLDVDQPTGLVTASRGRKATRWDPTGNRRLGLENQGDVDPQFITGATVTTHGTGVFPESVGAGIVSLRLVTAGAGYLVRR